MCLAEALLRIPDAATRDRLIRDKIATRRLARARRAQPLAVRQRRGVGTARHRQARRFAQRGHARAGAGLAVAQGRRAADPQRRRPRDAPARPAIRARAARSTRRSTTRASAKRAATVFVRHAGRGGDDRRRRAALSRRLRARDPRHRRGGRPRRRRTRAPASRSSFRRCIRATCARSAIACWRSCIPRVRGLAQLARGYDIGFNIDAEEADRLDLSLDLFEALAAIRRSTAGTASASSCRRTRSAPAAVIDWLVALARRHDRRLMVRLVKGAYWDTEIKRAQVDGLPDYPVFTRKVHTDVSYLACAKAMLAAPDALYPQFASHNAFTIAAVHTLAGDARLRIPMPARDGRVGVRPGGRQGPAAAGACRIYAPVGSHETLLAYLVRRLLENGANTSFVNRIVDPAVDIAELVADPVARARDTGGTPASAHSAARRALSRPPEFAGPRSLRRGGVARSRSVQLAAVAAAYARRRSLADARRSRTARADRDRQSRPTAATSSARSTKPTRPTSRTPSRIAAAPATRGRASTSTERADCLERAADLLEAHALRAHAAGRARGGQDVANAHRRSARGRRLLPLLRRAGAARARAARRRAARWRASRRGIFRWRYSSGRSARRWPPAIPCSRNPPSRRR